MKAADRYINHERLAQLNGKQCLELCRDVLDASGSVMKPRIPSWRLLESYKPNYAKYFRKAEFGECSVCKPAYEVYAVFKSLCLELDPDVSLPATVSIFVRERLCRGTTPEQRHSCEDNLCKHCSFTNYLIFDETLSRKKDKAAACETTFGELLIYHSD